ncbi:MAG TPA: nucleoside triphosphate pyrophosphohydrolase [Pyrinomonadaceae bacterium]|nr:nucleoside triphosphate pyrophosphohydrolase [Pyrinomonadaceae bacterium]
MSEAFDNLVSTMKRLRAPGGCPWDREQTHESLSRYLIEEAYELFDAIQARNEISDNAEALQKDSEVCEELGDLLLQVVFHSEIAEEEGRFTIDDVAKGITKKLVLRHPHVFGDEKMETAADVLQNWDKLKENERKINNRQNANLQSRLDKVPRHFPALLEALKLTESAAKVGFDWDDTEPIFRKINEEIEELKQAIENKQHSEIEDEIGDILFSIVNLARHHKIEPEIALKKTNLKFRRRFRSIEAAAKNQGKALENLSLEEMDSLWESAKDEEK